MRKHKIFSILLIIVMIFAVNFSSIYANDDETDSDMSVANNQINYLRDLYVNGERGNSLWAMNQIKAGLFDAHGNQLTYLKNLIINDRTLGITTWAFQEIIAGNFEGALPIQKAQNLNTNVVVGTTNFTETDVTTNSLYSVEGLRLTLENIAPELVGIEALIKNQQTYGIKPEFQIAVFCLESAYGKSSLARNKNNLAGLRAYPANGKSAYQNALSFNTKSECVEYFGKNLNKIYLSANKTSLSSISTVYCPPNSQSWASNVRSLMNKIGNTYYAAL